MVSHQSMRVEGADEGIRVQMVVDMIEIAIWDVTSVNRLNFIPEYRKYITMGSHRTNLNLH